MLDSVTAKEAKGQEETTTQMKAMLSFELDEKPPNMGYSNGHGDC